MMFCVVVAAAVAVTWLQLRLAHTALEVTGPHFSLLTQPHSFPLVTRGWARLPRRSLHLRQAPPRAQKCTRGRFSKPFGAQSQSKYGSFKPDFPSNINNIFSD